ncbi:MAG: VCBS repeat-containing protein [Planctomycetota bacterium]|nr:VCBS repeat-containing protein [Planctomycetota bacterium]
MQSTLKWAHLAVLGLVWAMPSCADKDAPAAEPEQAAVQPEAHPSNELHIEVPRPKLRVPQKIELLSESLTNAFNTFGDKVFIRDWAGLRSFFHGDFQGHDPFELPELSRSPLALGAQTHVGDVSKAPLVDRDTFMESFEARIGSWRRLEESVWKVRGAEFERAEQPMWGRVEWAAQMVGLRDEGGRELLELAGIARVDRKAGKGWEISQLEVHEVVSSRGGKLLFQDVTRAAGVHFEGLRYGTPGNDSDGWSGIASADVNGDGLWDVFVPSSTRSFLYLGRKGGGFEEASEEAGLQGIQGGTAVLFFDFENDGDQDLLVGHVGWKDRTQSLGGGQSIRAFRNEGEGKFRETTKIMGLDKIRCAAFGLTALDADGDGFVDVYVSAYGRMGQRRNDSWNEATNGEPDLLLRNVSGNSFQDVTKQSGLDDRGWTYSAVAADFDSDGDPDIYAVTTFGSNHLWINRGDGVFEDQAKAQGVDLRGNSMGVSVGDPNGDGALDLFLTCPSSNTGRRILKRFDSDERTVVWGDLSRMAGGNLLLEGDGKGAFQVVEGAGGAGGAGWAWGQALADFDLDGNQDIYCVNGFVTGDIPRDT